MNRPYRWIRCSGRGAVVLGAMASTPMQAWAAAVTNPLPQSVGAPGVDSATRTWLRAEILDIPLWEYLAFLLYVILAFYAAKLVEYGIGAMCRKWAVGTAVKYDDLLLARLRGPIKVIAFIILLNIGLHVFAWPKWATASISTGLKLIIACSLTYVAIKFVDVVMGLWQERVESTEESELDLDLYLFPLIRNTLKTFVLVVAVLVSSQNLGMNVTGLLASLSIGGLAVGLAAQDTLSNLLGAVAIFADKPFRVGDHIQLEEIDGTVETIGLRSTRVRNLEGFLVTIPNKTMAGANIFNISKRPGIRTVINLGVTWDTPAPKLERAIALIDEIYRPHPKTADLLISVNEFDSNAINIRVIHWWDSTSLKEYLLDFQKLNLELKRRCDAEGISFGSPSQNVYLRQNPNSPG